MNGPACCCAKDINLVVEAADACRFAGTLLWYLMHRRFLSWENVARLRRASGHQTNVARDLR